MATARISRRPPIIKTEIQSRNEEKRLSTLMEEDSKTETLVVHVMQKELLRTSGEGDDK